MTREIFINVEVNETRVAIKEYGRLAEIKVERSSDDGIVGNIYKGVVTDVLPGMEAAFVDVGLERNVFIHVGDIIGSKRKNKKELKIKSLLQKGDELVVQIVKEAIGNKGARATCYITIPGRYLVLMPTVTHVGVSRRIQDEEERKRLKTLVNDFKPGNMGFITRTAAEGATAEQLKRDFRFLDHQWTKIKQGTKKCRAPALLYKDLDLVQRVVRDTFTEDFDRLVVDNLKVYKGIVRATRNIAPHLRKKVELYLGKLPMFFLYEIEKEIKNALHRKVWLDSGGYLVIDAMEALTAIDVNTGKYVGRSNLDDTILKTNLEAAKEIPHQLKLRDIGGIIIIDFIDMDRQGDQTLVMDTLQKELEQDYTKTAVLGLTKLGLVEMTRKKVKQGIGEYLQRECHYCGGTGKVLTAESVAIETIHQLKKKISEEKFQAVFLEVHPEVAANLIGPRGKKLQELEETLGKDLYIRGNESMHLEEMKIIKTGGRKELANVAMPVKTGDELNLLVQSKHNYNSEDGIARLEGFVIDIIGAGKKVGQWVDVKIEDVYKTFAKARFIDRAK